jgi:hypothetical protein
MDEKCIPERILESNINGKRPVGQPRKIWVNAVEIENREISNVRIWKRESLDRQVWRRHLKEDKNQKEEEGEEEGEEEEEEEEEELEDENKRKKKETNTEIRYRNLLPWKRRLYI